LYTHPWSNQNILISGVLMMKQDKTIISF